MKNRKLLKSTVCPGELCGLPAGWQVEGRPRLNEKYLGIVDLSYTHLESRKKFRSRIAVKRYLGDGLWVPSSRRIRKVVDELSIEIPRPSAAVPPPPSRKRAKTSRNVASAAPSGGGAWFNLNEPAAAESEDENQNI